MRSKHNSALTASAKELRKNMTREEKHLWYDFLRNYPIRFYRQKVLGWYIADFYCADAKLIIELDGAQHCELDGLEKDAKRTAFLEEYGLKVISIQNPQIWQNFEGVCQYIDILVKQAINQSIR